MKRTWGKRVIICMLVAVLLVSLTGCQDSAKMEIDEAIYQSQGRKEDREQLPEDGQSETMKVDKLLEQDTTDVSEGDMTGEKMNDVSGDIDVADMETADILEDADATGSEMNDVSESNDVINKKTIERLENIQEIINNNFYFNGDKQAKQEGIIRGYVESLGDPYSVYYTAEEYAEYKKQTEAELEIVSVPVMLSFDEHNDEIVVMKVYENAKEAGVKVQDILVKIDGEDITVQDADTIINKLHGEEGTEITITIYRASDGKEHEFTMKRQKLEIPSIEYRMLENNIGYIQVFVFRDGTEWQFIKAIQDLNSLGMEGLVVDLRDNSGGSVGTTIMMLDYMLPEGIIGYQEDSDGNRKAYSSTGASQFEKPYVLLINGNSASASEIFAGAIKDFETGTIIGETTYGKGIGQRLFLFADGSAMKLTTSQFYTPSGKLIHQLGVKPDVEVKLDVETYRKSGGEKDNQLQAAIDTVMSKMGN